MKKTSVIMVSILILTVFFSGCRETGDRRSDEGNTSGNISNGGISVSSSEWIYFMNYADSSRLYRIRKNGDAEEKVSDNQAYFLNLMGNDLIYCNGSDGNRLYRMNLDDLSSSPISSDACENVLVSGEWIYYINRSTEEDKENYGSIFKVRPDGSGREKVSGNQVQSFTVSEDLIFYLDPEKQFLHRMKTDGTGQTALLERPSAGILIYEELIYYLNTENGENTIWKMDRDGKENRKLSGDKAASLNVSGGYIYYSATLSDSSDLEMRRMDLDGKNVMTFNDDNAVTMSIHEDWLVYIDIDFTTFMIVQTFVRTDGTGRKDLAVSGTDSPSELRTYPMKVKVSTDELTAESLSAYATNILKHPEPGFESVLFDETTDGAYVFIHTLIMNLTDHDIDLYQELGIMTDLGNEERLVYWPHYADITDESGKSEIGFHLRREEYQENLIIGAGETRDIQIYIDLYEIRFPVYLALLSHERLDPESAILIEPEETDYVVSWASSMEIMAERFPEHEIGQLSGTVHKFPDEEEEHFYYTFEVKEKGASEGSYYLVRRESGEIYIGETKRNSPDQTAVPVKPLP